MGNAYSVIKTPDTEAWHAIRDQHLGGSDAAVVAGISPFKSPLRLWMEKTGAIPREDLDGVGCVFWGTTLEPVVADHYARQHHGQVKVRRQPGFLVSKAHPFMGASLDRRVTDKDRGRGILEVKTTSAWNADAWTVTDDNPAGVPDAYQLQVQHYMAVTGDQFADVACLVGGQDYQERTIYRDQDLIDVLVELEARFWSMVQSGTMPEAIGHTDEAQALLARFPGSSEEVLDLSGSEAVELMNDYLAAKADEEAAQARKRQAASGLKVLMGDHTKGKVGSAKVAWSRFDRANTDLKALREEAPDLVAKYTTKSPSERFIITPGKA